MMRDLVEMIVKALVDRPEAVEISEIKGNHAHVIELNVAKEDLGQGDREGRGARLGDPHDSRRGQRQGEQAVHPGDHRALIPPDPLGTVSERAGPGALRKFAEAADG